MSKSINIIAAVDSDFGFGKDGAIPWHYPEDFKYFQKMTEGNTVIMGKATYQDLTGYFKGQKLLPKRECIVVTSDNDLYIPYENVRPSRSVNEAIDLAKEILQGDIFLIGGERIFTEGLSLADCVYLTMIPGSHECDRFFPYKKLNTTHEIHKSTEAVNTPEMRFNVYVNRVWTTNI
ncbi:dihydrofolate reductase [Xanthomonas phage Xoo-sp13]|nr:dihydrofolate reductase [Xanthomonas phage Xoo-sp13]